MALQSIAQEKTFNTGVYAIDEFPEEDLPWRIEWIGGIGY